MNLQEIFLVESTEEDRELITLSSSIIKKLKKYKGEKKGLGDFGQDSDFDDLDVPDGAYTDELEDEPVKVGTIGTLCNTFLDTLENVVVEVQSDYGMKNRHAKARGSQSISDDDESLGTYYPDENTIVINSDHLGKSYMDMVVAHELRHALDDQKSGGKALSSTKYRRARNPKLRKSTKDPYYGDQSYMAEPAEINARFIQVLHNMVSIIKRHFSKKDIDVEKTKRTIMTNFYGQMEKHDISVYFPEKERSKQYRRLLKRGVDFIQKEIAHQQKINQNKSI